jgi:hypothetical protein
MYVIGLGEGVNWVTCEMICVKVREVSKGTSKFGG